MRTKALLSLAALAAGVVAASASTPVYSLNIVGYYTVPVPGGLTFTANQLDWIDPVSGVTNNSLNNVLPNSPDGTEVFTYNRGTGHFNVDYNDVADALGWVDNVTFNPSTTTVGPGQGFFLVNSGTATNATFVGQVELGTALDVAMGPGLTAISAMTPQVLDLSSNGFPQVDGMEIFNYNHGTGHYDVYYNDIADALGWVDNVTFNPISVQPAVGQGFFVVNSTATTYHWTRSYTGN